MHYQHGSTYWTPETGAHEVHGQIVQKWAELGWEQGVLGYPTSDETNANTRGGRFSQFQRGAIYWTPATGAHAIWGLIHTKWLALGAESGFLGYPKTDQLVTLDGRGRYNHFQRGSIYSILIAPEWRAFEVHGLILDRWAALSWEQGFLGFPVSDELPMPGGGRYNVFEHGVVTWLPGQPQAVESPHHYERIYAQVRAQILSRFFALGPNGRRNHFAMWNALAGEVATQPANPQEEVEAEKARWRITRSRQR
jgi:uncharacterized protein with LGFP repeats